MSRYFFHVSDGSFQVDTEGVELPGMTDARAEAIRTAGEILRDCPENLWVSAEWQMHVTDEQRKTLLRLTFTVETATGVQGTFQ